MLTGPINFGIKKMKPYYLKEGIEAMSEKNQNISNAKQIMINCNIAYRQATLTYLMTKNHESSLTKNEDTVFQGLLNHTMALKYVEQYISGVEMK